MNDNFSEDRWLARIDWQKKVKFYLCLYFNAADTNFCRKKVSFRAALWHFAAM